VPQIPITHYPLLFSTLAQNLSIEKAVLLFADLSFTHLFLPEEKTPG
jgi:hypothetical protein